MSHHSECVIMSINSGKEISQKRDQFQTFICILPEDCNYAPVPTVAELK